jgi:hypothetical protein
MGDNVRDRCNSRRHPGRGHDHGDDLQLLTRAAPAEFYRARRVTAATLTSPANPCERADLWAGPLMRWCLAFWLNGMRDGGRPDISRRDGA